MENLNKYLIALFIIIIFQNLSAQNSIDITEKQKTDWTITLHTSGGVKAYPSTQIIYTQYAPPGSVFNQQGDNSVESYAKLDDSLSFSYSFGIELVKRITYSSDLSLGISLIDFFPVEDISDNNSSSNTKNFYNSSGGINIPVQISKVFYNKRKFSIEKERALSPNGFRISAGGYFGFLGQVFQDCENCNERRVFKSTNNYYGLIGSIGFKLGRGNGGIYLEYKHDLKSSTEFAKDNLGNSNANWDEYGFENIKNSYLSLNLKYAIVSFQ